MDTDPETLSRAVEEALATGDCDGLIGVLSGAGDASVHLASAMLRYTLGRYAERRAALERAIQAERERLEGTPELGVVDGATTALRRRSLALSAEALFDVCVRTLVDAGADPNVRASSSILNDRSADQDLNEMTPLICATMCRRVSLVEYLLRHGANAEMECATTGPALAVAVHANSGRLTSVLAENCAESVEMSVAMGIEETPLTMAVRSGAFRAAHALIKAGADTQATDEMGRTPLHLAMSTGNPRMVSLLVSNGANSRAVDLQGNTSLHVCTHVTAAQALLEGSGHRRAVLESKVMGQVREEEGEGEGEEGEEGGEMGEGEDTEVDVGWIVGVQNARGCVAWEMAERRRAARELVDYLKGFGVQSKEEKEKGAVRGAGGVHGGYESGARRRQRGIITARQCIYGTLVVLMVAVGALVLTWNITGHHPRTVYQLMVQESSTASVATGGEVHRL